VSNLKLQIAKKKSTLKVLLELMDIHKGIENVMFEQPSYDQKVLLELLHKHCLVFVAVSEDDNMIEAVYIFQWLECEYNAVCVHACGLNNEYDWVRYYNKFVLPEISKYTDYIVGFLDPSMKAVVRLYKRYGHILEFDEKLNMYKYLHII